MSDGAGKHGQGQTGRFKFLYGRWSIKYAHFPLHLLVGNVGEKGIPSMLHPFPEQASTQTIVGL